MEDLDVLEEEGLDVDGGSDDDRLAVASLDQLAIRLWRHRAKAVEFESVYRLADEGREALAHDVPRELEERAGNHL